ncbi:YdcF family protein [Flectobacillus major]|jgi:uncharacterized SAM-binding protein YcdF (DUF218 family)|uniref:YdcF family protein n=1 Tax=Flectobacillus major TaxID=103 RepID=UPI00040351B2|nr:YdcF family protein [Flectobacillus major]
MNGILIICGANNTHDGELTHIAFDRLLTALNFLKYNPDFKILCTGGFGNHFNTSDYPHAQYLQNFLLENGIPHEQFLEFILSENTIEDAQLCKRVLERHNPEVAVVISSDYHLERVRLSFLKFCGYPSTVFLAAKSSLFEDELERLIRQEQQAVNRLRMML